MKTNFINLVCFLFIFLSLNKNGNSQTTNFGFDCELDTTSLQQPPQFSLNPICVDSTKNYIPDLLTSHKVIKLNIHYMQRATGEPLNFTSYDDGLGDTSFTGYDHANLIVGYANAQIANNTQMHLPLGNNTPVLDHGYSYILKNVYFHADDNKYLYSQTSGSYLNNTYGENDVLDLFLNYDGNSTNGTAGGSSAFYAGYVRMRAAWQYYRAWNNAGFWASATTFNHEVGHFLSLSHTVRWNSSGACGNIDDHCDDTPSRNDMIAANGTDPCCGFGQTALTCSNNLMDYTKMKALTPEQLGRIHHTLITKVPDFIDNTYCERDSTKTVVIPSNANIVLNRSEYFYGDIILESDAQLTIKCVIYMPKNAKIIVNAGAKLTIDGGKITNACDDVWHGIVAKGNPNVLQGGNQARVKIKNDATIEHAYCAVRLENGGLLSAFNSTFENNLRSVEILAYGYTNLTYFKEVDFIWNDDLRYDNIYAHVTLDRVKGVWFQACNFADNRTNPASPWLSTPRYNTSTGIGSIDANYKVTAHCTDYANGCLGGLENPDWHPCTFTNLDFGIYAVNVASETSIIIEKSIFKNNLYGIDIIRSNSPTMTQNQFVIDSVDNHYAAITDRQYGILTTRTGAIRIEENLFANEGAPNNMVGIVSTDLGEVENQIYRNTFTNLEYGNVTQGKNRSVNTLPQGFKGLQFLCNTNNENRYDHRIKGTLWTYGQSANNGVKNINGSVNEPSGNVFTQLGNNREDYINESSNPLGYYFHVNNSIEKPIETQGNFFSNGVLDPNGCMSHFSEYPISGISNGGGAQLVTEFGSVSTILQTTIDTYTGLIDGGNPPFLLQEIENLSISNQSALRQTLINNSPYLSEMVIKAVLEQPTSLYPHIWGYELILDNIDVVHNSDFISFLSTKSEPMPNWMIQNLESLASNNVYTDKFVKESEISALSTKRSFNADMIIRDIKNDSVVNMDSLRYWIENNNDVLAQTQIIDTYLQDRDLAMAQIKVNELQADIPNYSEHLHVELNDFVKFKNKLIEILIQPETLANLSETDHTFITNIAETGTGVARYQAQEILCFYYQECADYSPVLDDVVTKSTILKETPKAKESIKNKFVIYPNPANTWVAVEFPLETENIEIEIHDLSGKLVLAQNINKPIFIWETTLINNGTYIITIISHQNIISTEQIVIQH